MAKKLVVLGGGESGVGVAILARRHGFEVFLSDAGTIKEKYTEVLKQYEIPYEEGKHTDARILSADLVMKSPGIPHKTEIVKKIKQAGIKIVSEMEFAAPFTKAEIIGITGSNGKTTTTALTYHILRNSGLNVALGGNIGKSFAWLVATGNYDYYVLEISSFQLDDVYTFRPNVAVLTNITPDHLDRYEYNFQNYISAKFNITRFQTEKDYFIYCADDAVTAEYIEKYPSRARKIPFSIYKQCIPGGYVQNDTIFIHINQTQFTMSTSELGLKGPHNTYNSLAAGIVASIYDVRKEEIRKSLSDFRLLEHRLESVAKIRNIEFINDSKATNVNSTWYALETMTKPVIWIAGGVDKGNDYSVLVPLVEKKVKALVCLGEDNIKLHQAFGKVVDVIVNTVNMRDAVRMAYQLGSPGDVVLLSPACASFDLFENYEDRGRKFKEEVIKL
ncbi:MAG: UDP-N-acetylmuramoyl-L-alanine--D-glutamate ligase [Chitinophagales bacterium]|nr:UDP-N-acetylmuramoyl-L-alanine--D-glutamate ligase [Chitinophagales bacterium]